MRTSKTRTFIPGTTLTVVVLIIAITGRIIQILFYHDALFDSTFQLIATHNFLQGHGVSVATVSVSDLSAVVYSPLVNWPPGYSLIIAPFYLLSGNNPLIAGLALDILAATAIIIYSRQILKLLDCSIAIVNAYTLLAGFYIYYFYFIGSTDQVAIAFFLASLYYILLSLKRNRYGTGISLISGFCLLLAASTKYLFFPLSICLPLFLLVYGLYAKHPGIKKWALMILTVVSMGIAAILIYQQSVAHSALYVSAPGRGFYPSHLLSAYPFIPATFVSFGLTEKIIPAAAPVIFDTWRVLHAFIFLAIIFYAGRKFLKAGLKNVSTTTLFLYITALVAIVITLVLLILSLFVEKEEITPGRWWTYIQDPRYYGLIEILLQCTVFVLFQHYRARFNGAMKWLLTILPLLLLPELLRGVLFDANRIIKTGKEKYYWQKDLAFQRYADQIVKQKEDSLQTTLTVVTGTSHYYNQKVSLYSNKPVLNESGKLENPSSINTRLPVLLIAILEETSIDRFRSFLSHPGTELAGYYNGFYFYNLYVNPH